MLRRIWILSAKRGGEECAINVAFIQVMPFTMDIVRKHLRLCLRYRREWWMVEDGSAVSNDGESKMRLDAVANVF